jgi:hypothetical protein
VTDTQGKPTKKFLKDLERHMENIAQRAKANKGMWSLSIHISVVNHLLVSVLFDFDFAKNCRKKTTKVPERIITWDDEVPRTAVSSDGIDLAMYAPKAVGEKAEVWIPKHCLASSMLTHFGIPGRNS